MKEKYVWLNMEDGTFSDSWEADTLHESSVHQMIEASKSSQWKLIKYQCLNDEDFEITRHFKLR